jgi:hypothetical protein
MSAVKWIALVLLAMSVAINAFIGYLMFWLWLS